MMISYAFLGTRLSRTEKGRIGRAAIGEPRGAQPTSRAPHRFECGFIALVLGQNLVVELSTLTVPGSGPPSFVTNKYASLASNHSASAPRHAVLALASSDNATPAEVSDLAPQLEAAASLGEGYAFAD